MLNADFSNSKFIPKLIFKVVDNLDELDQLGPEWEALLERARGDSLHFQSFAWCRHWWRHYAEANTTPHVVVGYAIDRPVLIWPLALNCKISGRTLSWAGMPLSQYGDIVVEDHDAALSWVDQAWQFLRSSAKADLIELSRVREDSVIGAALLAMEHVSACVQQGPSIDLGQFEDMETYRKGLSKKARKHRNRMRRLLGEQGELNFRTHTSGEGAIAAIDAAMSYKAAWLKAKGMVSRAFGDARKGDFWKGLAQDGDAAGLIVSELCCGDMPIGIEIALRHGGRHVAHVGAYHPDFEPFSPGTVQMEETIADCFENGISVYDLLPPNDDYKMRWANQTETVSDYTIALGGRGHVMKQLGAVNVNAMLKTGFYSLPASMRKSMATLVQ